MRYQLASEIRERIEEVLRLIRTGEYSTPAFAEAVELLERIREIPASERRFYLKITDIYEQCSIDYDKSAEISRSTHHRAKSHSNRRASGL